MSEWVKIGEYTISIEWVLYFREWHIGGRPMVDIIMTNGHVIEFEGDVHREEVKVVRQLIARLIENDNE